jgi:hypothetical protein
LQRVFDQARYIDGISESPKNVDIIFILDKIGLNLRILELASSTDCQNSSCGI